MPNISANLPHSLSEYIKERGFHKACFSESLKALIIFYTSEPGAEDCESLVFECFVSGGW